MYAAHFGLREPPFAITPDPAYVYLSRHHREALAHLLYGTGENGGFVQLTGEVGTGKTTLVRALLVLEQGLDRVDIALCLNPRLTVEELLATVCDELGVAYPREHHTLKPLLDALNAHLLRTHAAGRRTVLIVDEAQNLSREVLEQIRLLTNLETAKHKLLRIILVGQPELRALLARPDLRQLAQRITARYHLPPLDQEETAAYIGHRLRVADGRGDLLTRSALRAVYRRSGGIPRLINIICDRALLGAYGQGARQVSAGLVRQAAREALHDDPANPGKRSSHPWLASGIGFAGLLMIGIGLWLPHTDPTSTTAPTLAPTVASIPAPTAVRSPVPPPDSGHSDEAVTTSRATGSPPAPTSDTDSADLAALLRKASVDNANERLLAVWGITEYRKSKTAFCEQVKTHALRCLTGRGDWETLRRFDRPAVLRLTRPGGTDAPTVLRTLVEDKATLDVAGETITVPLEQLKPLWTGRYLLLWRPQTDQAVIGPGNAGTAVRWLRQRLALATGQPVSESLSDTFDADLAKQLQAFQQERGLRPDGIAGGRTLVLLSNLAPTPGTPVLGQSPREP